ncbi:hypothetical protein EC991_009875 [Linnemannia zychae]|nr:hypothetical protein EC991_009875 [Linnemannia zychae]
MRDYPHAQGSDNSANDQLRRPTLPPPAALLSGAEGKPQRIYGRDSTADDLWPPLPRPTRVVPIDAPNEKRPFQFNGSSMLPPVLPPPTSSAPSSSSSSSILPYPSGFSSGSMEQKPRRIYGIDAADVPARFPAPPPLPSSYGPNGSHYSKHQDISDEMESGESRKRVFGRDSSDYQQRPYGSSAATSPTSSAPSYGSSQPYGYNAPPPPQAPAPQSHHYASSDMDRSSRYDEYKHRGWSNGQSSSSSSSMGHGGPNYGSSSRPYSRAQSPTVDIKPPSWYQDYANSVPPKPQTQPAYQQRSDSGYYGGSGNSHHYQQQQQQHHHHSSSHGYGGSSSLAGIHEMDENEEGYHHHRSSTKSAGSKRSHKSGHGSSPSVHPFDTMDPSANSSKSKKPKRIKNAAGQEDMIVMDDEFYAVKAKRKRANASQLSVLNAAFERSYFPSTEERLRLSKQCRMCPRTVQIWFQNKRQSVKARSEAMEAAVSGTAITDELLEQRLQMLEEEQNLGGVDGQKRSTRDVADEDYEEDDESGPGELHGSDKSHRRHPHGGSGGVSSSKQRRSSGNNPGTNNGSSGTGLPTPSDAVMSALHIQLDGRSVDYFSRKRRATIAKMERNEQQKKEKEELQRKREQEQQLIIQQYQKHQQEQVQKQRLQQQQQEGQTVGQN